MHLVKQIDALAPAARRNDPVSVYACTSRMACCVRPARSSSNNLSTNLAIRSREYGGFNHTRPCHCCASSKRIGGAASAVHHRCQVAEHTNSRSHALPFLVGRPSSLSNAASIRASSSAVMGKFTRASNILRRAIRFPSGSIAMCGAGDLRGVRRNIPLNRTAAAVTSMGFAGQPYQMLFFGQAEGKAKLKRILDFHSHRPRLAGTPFPSSRTCGTIFKRAISLRATRPVR